jgi:serine/threonine protein kinase
VAERIGVYELGPQIGAGGMGRVYRARDPRLERDVAIKLLPDDVRDDAERIARFEREARTVAALGHPNVMVVHDVGRHEGIPFLVCELLEGETLRDRIAAGALPWRKAVEIARQIAMALAAAHRAGVVHRDVKPSNVFITRDGVVKLLDFGIARSTVELPTGESTITGAVIGTAGYMAPEQVRGESADARADIFALGAVLFEMLAGKKAFGGATDIERGAAILREEPAGLPARVPAPVARIVMRCLEKSVDERIASARDLGFALEALLDVSETRTRRQPARKPRAGWLLAALPVVAALLAVWWFAGGPSAEQPRKEVTFTPVTFRRGSVLTARFTPEGDRIIYSGSWSGDPVRTYLAVPGQPESTPVYAPGLVVLGVSKRGDAALLAAGSETETMSRASLAGGEPRALLDGIVTADWVSDRDELAVVRRNGQRFVAEFPVGHPVFDNSELIGDLRVSADGKWLAVSHRNNASWSISVFDRSGTKRTLLADWGSVSGLAFAAGGDEVWFAGTEAGRTTDEVYAVPVAGGKVRTVLPAPAHITLHDVSRLGRVLISREQRLSRAVVQRAGDSETRELTWLDRTWLVGLSADGTQVVFNERGVATANRLGTIAYLRRTDGTPAVKLGTAPAFDMSPDGRFALGMPLDDADPQEHLQVIPTGSGALRTLPPGVVRQYQEAAFFPDGRSIALVGIEDPARGEPRIYVQSLDGGDPRAVTAVNVTFDENSKPVSMDGALLVVRDEKLALRVISLADGSSRELPGARPTDVMVRWGQDGRVYLLRRNGDGFDIVAVDAKTGQSETIRSIRPLDPAGAFWLPLPEIRPKAPRVIMTPDARTVVYSYSQVTSQLFVAEGLR